MSYEDKAMASRSSSPSPKTIVQDSDYGRVMSVCPSIECPQLPIQHSGLNGPVAILWDIENCPVPSDVRPEDVAGNIRMALQVHPVIKGAVTMFSAYGDFNAFPRRLREGCQRTGVKLVDVPNGRKDAADKAILVDMFLYALDNRPPSSIMLISGDVDFAPALHILGQRGYTIILVIPAGVGVSSALSNAGRFVWDWPSVAHGEGFVPPKALVHRGSDLAGYLMSRTIGDNHDTQNEEESIVYRGTSQCESSARVNINQAYRYNYSHVSRDPSRASNFMSDYTCNSIMSGPYFNSSRSQSLLVGLNDNPAVNQNCTQEETWWVRPGDLQGLKGQLVRLLEMSGGSLPLVRVPAEYLKVSGRPLYMAEYGVYKLVNLVKKMTDAFIVVGKGHKKVLCLRNFGDRNVKKCPSTPAMEGKEKKGKGVLEENTDIGIPPSGSSSEELSDDERNVCTAIGAEYGFDDNIGTFRQEIQELLVCYSCPVPLHTFEALYEQRYKKALDYQSFGVEGLEELIEKVRDVVELCDDRASNRKFLVSSYASG